VPERSCNVALMPWSNDWLGRRFRRDGPSQSQRGVLREYDAPSYSVSTRSVLIVLAVAIVLVIGAIVFLG